MNQTDNSDVRILIVDDTSENMEIIGRTLASENYDLYLADSGYMALELMENTSFNLILLDIMMPGMDGFEVLNRIRERENGKDIPVIFLTARVDIESILRGFEMGAVDYVRKPFNGLELKARVRHQVELQRVKAELEYKNRCLQDAYEQIRLSALTDPLTQLMNRRGILERLEIEKNRVERNNISIAVIMGDIDRFKIINDTYGHACGDKVLVMLANIMKGNFRKQDAIARWGGEEFLMVLPDTNGEGALVLAEKLRIQIASSTFNECGDELRFSMTFGIAVAHGSVDIDMLISKADKALYKGKTMGRNCCVYDGPDLIIET